MPRPIALLAAAAFAALSSTASFSQDSLSGDAIKSLIGGKRVFLATPYGLEFPLRYLNNGQVLGDASGFTLASMFAPKETGRWWVEDARLCQQWPTWYKGRAFCFTVTKTGDDSIQWTRDDGFSGTARIKS